MPKKYSTKGLFSLFKREVNKWANLYGLKEYDFCIEREKLPDDREADVTIDDENRIAVVRLNSTWSYKPTEEGIRLAAFHECTEVLLDELEELGKKRYGVIEEDFI